MILSMGVESVRGEKGLRGKTRNTSQDEDKLQMMWLMSDGKVEAKGNCE